MNKGFSVTEYVETLGEELIAAFEQGRLATTPGTVGETRERAIREKLRQLLPHGIGVGSGFVIDAQENVSNQIDIILYEEDICPVFRINNSTEAAFYPCEGVFAVGEVKSTIGSREVDDILEKIASVRKLNRVVKPQKSILFDGQLLTAYRHYGNTMAIEAGPEDSYEQNAQGLNQIWGFGIARETTLTPNTLADKLSGFCGHDRKPSAPNLIILTSGIAVKPALRDNSGIKTVLSAIEANGYISTKLENPLGSLLTSIILVYQRGRTAEVSALFGYLSQMTEGQLPVLHYSPIL